MKGSSDKGSLAMKGLAKAVEGEGASVLVENPRQGSCNVVLRHVKVAEAELFTHWQLNPLFVFWDTNAEIRYFAYGGSRTSFAAPCKIVCISALVATNLK